MFGLGIHNVNIKGNYNNTLESVGSFSGSQFMGNKSIRVSKIIPGARYGVISLDNNFDYSEVFNVVYPSTDDVLSGKGNFTTTSDWTPSGEIFQSSLTFTTANSEVKTTANLSFNKDVQYKVSFSISPSSENIGSSSIVLFRLGGGSYYNVTIPYEEMIVGSVKTVVITSSDVDDLFYIKSGEINC